MQTDGWTMDGRRTNFDALKGRTESSDVPNGLWWLQTFNPSNAFNPKAQGPLTRTHLKLTNLRWS